MRSNNILFTYYNIPLFSKEVCDFITEVWDKKEGRNLRPVTTKEYDSVVADLKFLPVFYIVWVFLKGVHSLVSHPFSCQYVASNDSVLLPECIFFITKNMMRVNKEDFS
ncbi:MAG: hypothetical protein K0S71_2529 [Clostridia bacterium]|nr:hypothetical protein [Clostridia bacterium]